MPDPLRKTLSATETPALFNASPYVTRWMLLQKFIHGRELAGPEHNRMDWGKRMQPLILQTVAEEQRVGVEIHVNADDRYVRRGQLGCTRDADIYCPDRGYGTVEAKAVFDYGVWMKTWEGGKRPPRHIEIQTQQQMLVGDGEQPFTWGLIAVWVCGDMHYFERKPIPELWEALRTEAAEFFHDVAVGNEGSPFGDPVETPLMNECFPPVEAKVLDLTTHEKAEEYVNQARMIAFHREHANANEREKRRLEAIMRVVMGDAELVTLPGGVQIRNSLVRKKGHTVSAHSYIQTRVFIPKEGGVYE